MVSKPRVFVDSNVWFSAFYKKGTASELINSFLQKRFEIVISEQVLEEVLKNIKNKIPQALHLAYQFFQVCPLTIIKDPQLKELEKFAGLAEKKDLPILIPALKYDCRFFITGNKKDFRIRKIKKNHHLVILNPREALTALQ